MMKNLLFVCVLVLTSLVCRGQSKPPKVNGLPVSRYYDITWDGANFNNAVMDNGVLITARAAALSAAGGGTIILPEGIGQVSTTIILPDNIKLLGRGVLKENTILSPVINVTGTNVLLEDFTVQSIENAASFPPVDINQPVTIQSRAGILFSASNSKARNVKVIDKSTGFKTDTVTNIVFEGCTGVNTWLVRAMTGYNFCNNILILAGGRVTVRGGFFKGSGNGIGTGFTARDVSVDGAYISDTADNGVYYSSVWGGNVLNCWMTNIYASGVTARGFDIKIAHNNMRKFTDGVGISVTGLGIVPTDPDEIAYTAARGMPANNVFNGRNITIDDNTIQDALSGGISVNVGTLASVKGYVHIVQVSNNKLYNVSGTGGVNDNNADPIVVAADDVNIFGNEIYGISHVGSVIGLLGLAPAPVSYFQNFTVHHNTLNIPLGATGISMSQIKNAIVHHNTVLGATNSLVIGGCDTVVMESNILLGDSSIPTGFARLGGAPSTNVVYRGNTSSSQFQNGSAPLNFFAEKNNPPIISANMEFLKMDYTNNTMSLGRMSGPSADEKVPLWVRHQADGAVQVILQNDVPLGNINASIRLALFAKDASGYFGAWPSDGTVPAFRKKIGIGLNSDAAAMAIGGLFTGQTFDVFAGSSTMGAQLAGGVWRMLGGQQVRRITDSGTYAVLTNDMNISSTATSTKNMPANSTMFNGAVQRYYSKTGTLTVARNGSDTINGVAADDTLIAGTGAEYISDGTSNWERITPVATPAYIALTDAATITWTVNPLRVSQNATVTLGGNRTLAFSGASSGMSGVLIVVQDGMGGRSLTLPGGSKVISGGGGAITLTATAGATDILTWTYDGTSYYWNYGKNYN